MRALPELLPEVYAVENPPPLPPEATGEHPYLTAVIKDGLLGDDRNVEDNWLGLLDGFRLDTPEGREVTRRWGNRGHLRHVYSWAIPNEAALARLQDLSPLIELGAGGGYWAHLLRQRGVDLVAVDRNPPPPEGRTRGWSWRLWTEIERADGLEVIDDYQERTLMLCWPSPGVDEDCWAAEALRRSPQERLVFIGEGAGGCTGSKAFHALLEERYQLEEEIVIPRLSLVHDLMFVYRRRSDG